MASAAGASQSALSSRKVFQVAVDLRRKSGAGERLLLDQEVRLGKRPQFLVDEVRRAVLRLHMKFDLVFQRAANLVVAVEKVDMAEQVAEGFAAEVLL
jgi:hypothetical protein